MTGMIAGGKSTAAAALASEGAVCIDADRIAAEVTRRSEVIAQIGQRLDKRLILPDGTLNRPGLAKLVFGDAPRCGIHLNTLEAIVHPHVRTEILQRLHQAELEQRLSVCLDVPLLIRSGWFRACDDIVCVTCDPKIQRQRIADRGWPPGELQRRNRRQTDLSVKRRHCSYHLDSTESQNSILELTHWFRAGIARLPAKPNPCQSGCDQ